MNYLKVIFSVLACLFLIVQYSFGQTAPAILWDRVYGGQYYDEISSIKRTNDGGYITGGITESIGGGDVTQPGRGLFDYWVVKVNGNGDKLWDKTFGGTAFDVLTELQQTSDGGYIVGGFSNSTNGFGKSQPSRGADDYWVIKLDSSGNKVWDKVFGGTAVDFLWTLKQTADGGYILGGDSYSGIGGEKSQACKGFNDYWVIKLDANGNKTWDKSFGGDGYDNLNAIHQTPDSGYILGGYSSSKANADKSMSSFGTDYWVVKLDATGNKLWDKTIGGSHVDVLQDLELTGDGGYILGGYSASNISGDKSQPSKGDFDYWVVKLNANGNKVWDKTFGGDKTDYLYAIKQANDGGYIFTGYSDSGQNGDKSQPCRGSVDYWVVKIDANGNFLWDKTIGGNYNDFPQSIALASDGGYILAGYSESDVSGEKTQPPKFSRDFWLVKLAAPCDSLKALITGLCSNGNPTINVTIIGMQPGVSGNPSWTLTYQVNGVSQTLIGTTPTIPISTTAQPGTTVTLNSIVSGGCFSNLNQTITIPPVPSAPNVVAGKSCDTEPVTLTAFGAPNGGNYHWYETATSTTSVFSNPSGIFNVTLLNTSTTYYVAASNNMGCEGPRTPVIATNISVPVTGGSEDSVCVNDEPVHLTGFAPLGGFWSGPGIDSTGLFTPNLSLTGTQILTYSVTENGCAFSSTKKMTVYYPADLGGDRTACEGEEVILQTQYSKGMVRWNDGSTNSILKVRNSGKYWVQHTLDNCTTADTVQVTFKFCPPPFIPNVITPNGDNLNETFSPQYLSNGKWDLKIFNRWGILLHDSENYQNDWPRRNISDGIYYYDLKNAETGQKFKGWIEILH